jgi:hypothetical protein
LSKGFATGGFWRKATVHVCPFLGAERTCRTGRLRSHFDPEQKSATSKVSSVDRSLKVGGRHRVAVIVATVLERVRRPARLASAKGS